MGARNHDIAAIVFDLDDTLYPEIQYVRSGFRAVARELANPGVGQSVEQVLDMLLYTYRTGARDRVFNVVLEQLGRQADSQAIRGLVRTYRTHQPTLQLDPAVSRTLADLKRTHKLGLLSDGYLPAQRLKFEALRLGYFFEHVLFTEALGREYWKPHPRGFELTAKALGVGHEQIAYVADNPGKDFVAPNRLGWLTVQVNLPSRVHVPKAPTSAHCAHLAVPSVDRLYDIVTGL